MSKGRAQRTEENEEEDKQHVALPDGLRALMGGRKFCPQEELTREVLLQYLGISEKWTGFWILQYRR